jgi:hypothetical protein
MSVFKHQDDDGDLSIVAQGGDLVFICSKKHYWVIESKLQEPDLSAKSGQTLKAIGDFQLGAIASRTLGLIES